MINTKDLGFNFDNTYSKLPNLLFTKQNVTPVRSPKITILNNDLAQQLGLDFSPLSADDQASVLSGNRRLKGSEPLAQAYAGHQYGNFTMLGDGRALLLGEHITPKKQRVDIHLKGIGRTPYSHQGDGRGALEPMLREYIISEAMHGLGIPTTRSLAVIATSEPVYRDTVLPGAILTRVASSHIRVGTFEYGMILKDKSVLKHLIDYTIWRHYPELQAKENKVLAFFNAVIDRQAELIINWMRVGFIHGVMNTDNMTLCGETIDYGPCAFIDNYDPLAVFSSIDYSGRYAYANQAKIGQWNLSILAETLLPFLHHDINEAIKIAEHALKKYSSLYKAKWLAMMRSKLGIIGNSADDQKLIEELLIWMGRQQADYTMTFRDLMTDKPSTHNHYSDQKFQQWYIKWQKRRLEYGQSLSASTCLMRDSNPLIIPRNHIVERVLKSASSNNDLKSLYDFVKVLKNPYQSHPDLEYYQLPPRASERVYQTFCGT